MAEIVQGAYTEMQHSFSCQQEVGNYLMCHPVLSFQMSAMGGDLASAREKMSLAYSNTLSDSESATYGAAACVAA